MQTPEPTAAAGQLAKPHINTAPSAQQPAPAPNIVFLSGEANPLKLGPDDRRFMVVHLDAPIPAPSNWPRLLPTDKPVLRNELWHAERDVGAGTWAVSVLASTTTPRVVARQVYVVDDHGSLQPVPHPTVQPAVRQ